MTARLQREVGALGSSQLAVSPEQVGSFTVSPYYIYQPPTNTGLFVIQDGPLTGFVVQEKNLAFE